VNTSTTTQQRITALKQTIKASCDQELYVCNDCDCWIDLLDGEPIDGCFHEIQHEDTKGTIACIQCGMIMDLVIS